MKRKHDRFKLSLRTAKWMAFPLMFLFVGCGEGPGSDTSGGAGTSSEAAMDEEGMMPARRQKAFKKIFHAVPSPIETAMLLERSGINFDSDALHDLDKAVGYSTTELQSVNLGIYAGDLSYAVIFNQNQQSVDYLNTAAAFVTVSVSGTSSMRT